MIFNGYQWAKMCQVLLEVCEKIILFLSKNGGFAMLEKLFSFN